jgi:WD40 repeat protein
MAAEDTNVVRSFKVASGRELSALETPHEREDMGMIVKTSLHCAVFVGDGTTVLTNGSFTKDVDAWDLATGESLWTLDAKVSFIRGMTVSPDERIVALNGRESNPRRTTLSFWDTAMRRELLHIDVGEEYVTSMAFSADGNQLVTGLETGTALVWDVSAVWDKLGGNPSD